MPIKSGTAWRLGLYAASGRHMRHAGQGDRRAVRVRWPVERPERVDAQERRQPFRMRLLFCVALGIVSAMMVVLMADSGGSGQLLAGGEARKNLPSALRTDTEPLAQRFPALPTPFTARWMSGIYGDPDLPGPTTYWIDAVITLDHDQATSLALRYGLATGGLTPIDTTSPTTSLVFPPGPFSTSEALNTALSGQRWAVSAYLDLNAGQLVLIAAGT